MIVDDFEFVFSEPPGLESPVFLEGLPGVGNVGRLAVTHMINAFGGTKFGDMHSTSFPHQVKNLPDGTLRLMRNELHSTTTPRGMIFLTGDMQPMPTDFKSHYQMADAILDLCQELKVGLVITVGGYALGEDIDGERKVFIGTSGPDAAQRYLGEDLLLLKDDPGTPIVGVSGLLPAMASARNIDALCLLGQTTGEVKPDLEAASAVLKVISSILEVEIDQGDLSKASQSIEREMNDIMRRIERVERMRPDSQRGKEGYIH
jgi:uncharacterized protein (TIGR00162 family)